MSFFIVYVDPDELAVATPQEPRHGPFLTREAAERVILEEREAARVLSAHFTVCEIVEAPSREDAVFRVLGSIRRPRPL